MCGGEGGRFEKERRSASSKKKSSFLLAFTEKNKKQLSQFVSRSRSSFSLLASSEASLHPKSRHLVCSSSSEEKEGAAEAHAAGKKRERKERKRASHAAGPGRHHRVQGLFFVSASHPLFSSFRFDFYLAESSRNRSLSTSQAKRGTENAPRRLHGEREKEEQSQWFRRHWRRVAAALRRISLRESNAKPLRARKAPSLLLSVFRRVSWRQAGGGEAACAFVPAFFSSAKIEERVKERELERETVTEEEKKRPFCFYS